MTSPPTTLTLIRHGLSDYNLDGRFQGSGDEAGLSARGLRQALLVGRSLCGLPLDRVYSSPLRRAYESARIITRGAGLLLPVRSDDRLREVDIPGWEGLRHPEIRDTDPDAFARYRDTPGAFEIQAGGTSLRPLAELYERASGFLEEEVLGMSSSILAVSHLGTNQALINAALGLSEGHHHRLQQSQCGVSRLVFDVEGRARLTLLNDASPLGEDLPKIKSRKAGVRAVLLGLGERCVPGRPAGGTGTRRDRSVWTESGLDFPAERFPGAKAFSLADGVVDDALAGAIRCLRARDDRLSTVVVIARQASLPGVARHLFGVPEALFAGVGNAPVFRMVVHDSACHGRPIVQAIDAESDRFSADGGVG